jgi:hypothetical protein
MNAQINRRNALGKASIAFGRLAALPKIGKATTSITSLEFTFWKFSIFNLH